MDKLRLRNVISSLLLSVFLIALAGCKGGGSDSAPAPQASASPPASGGGGGSGVTGTAVLSWAPPTTNTDGSPVDLMGFVIYQGSSPANMTSLLMVGAIETTTVIDNLPSGTHFFAVAALSVSGAQSALSNIQSKTI